MKPNAPKRTGDWDRRPRALPIAEFCDAYHTSPATVWRGIAAGRIKTITLSGRPNAKRYVLLDSIEQEAS